MTVDIALSSAPSRPAAAEPRWMGLPGRIWVSALIVLAVGLVAPMIKFIQFTLAQGRPLLDALSGAAADIIAGLAFAVLVVAIHELWTGFLRRRWPQNRPAAMRYAVQFCGTLVYGVLAAIVFVWVYAAAIHGVAPPAASIIDASMNAILIPIAITGVSESFGLNDAYQAERLRRVEARRAAAEARYDALKNRLAPHFLFNSLGALAQLASEAPERAEKFVAALTEIYRYVLSTEGADAARLKDDWRAARSFLTIHQERHPGAIIFDANINPEAEDKQVVPLTLLTFVENAIKHNVATERAPLEIRIFADKDGLRVENAVRPALNPESSGIGLDNLDTRYRIAGARGVTAGERDGVFAATAPYLPDRADAHPYP